MDLTTLFIDLYSTLKAMLHARCTAGDLNWLDVNADVEPMGSLNIVCVKKVCLVA